MSYTALSSNAIRLGVLNDAIRSVRPRLAHRSYGTPLRSLARSGGKTRHIPGFSDLLSKTPILIPILLEARAEYPELRTELSCSLPFRLMPAQDRMARFRRMTRWVRGVAPL